MRRTLEDVEDAQVHFKKYDLDNSGTIDKKEFYELIKQVTEKKKMGALLLQRMADMHFKNADKDNSGTIDETEFLVIYSELILQYEKEGEKPAS